MFKRSGGFLTMQVTCVWITWLIKSSRYVFTISCLLLVCYMCSWSVTLMSPQKHWCWSLLENRKCFCGYEGISWSSCCLRDLLHGLASEASSASSYSGRLTSFAFGCGVATSRGSGAFFTTSTKDAPDSATRPETRHRPIRGFLQPYFTNTWSRIHWSAFFLFWCPTVSLQAVNQSCHHVFLFVDIVSPLFMDLSAMLHQSGLTK